MIVADRGWLSLAGWLVLSMFVEDGRTDVNPSTDYLLTEPSRDRGVDHGMGGRGGGKGAIESI